MNNDLKKAILEAFELVYTKVLIKEELFKAANEITAKNDRWITLKPHGKEAEDYKRLLIKDGEDIEDAMHRQGYYKKRQAKDEQKEKQEDKKEQSKQEKITLDEATQSIRNLVKIGFEKTKFYEQLDKETDKLWNAYSKAVRETTIYFDDSDEVKKVKKEKLDAIHQEYANKRDERSKVVNELNQIIRETKQQQIEVLNKLKDKIDIEKSLKNYNSSEITAKIEKVISEYNIDKLTAEYKEVSKQRDESNAEWLKYINSATTTEEQDKRVEEHTEWYKNSELKKKLNAAYDKVFNFAEYRQKAISEALQIANGGNFNITTIKNSKLTDKVKKANELLSGIVNKDYLPDFSPHANGKTGRANATGNIINITSKHGVSTYIHEAMHWIERVNPNVLANSIAFLEYRTKGETPEKLKKLTGIKYENIEVAKPDKFFNPYCGKIYDRATEIMSMGVQRLFEEPEKFMKEDKEYFDFVIANLQGKI